MQRDIQGFIEYIAKERRLSLHTVVAYDKDLAQFSAHIELLGIQSLSEIDHHDIRSWIVSVLEGARLQPRSVNRKLSCLRSFYRYLLRNGVVSSNPMSRIASLKTKRSLPIFMEPQQMERLLNDMEFEDGFAGLRDRLLIELLYATGMRRAEAIGLQTSDVDLHELRLRVVGKRKKERIIPITDHLASLIHSYLRLGAQTDIGTHQYLLVRDDGSKMTDGFVYQKVNRYLRLVTTSGKKSPHLLRHTFATHMLNNGADINAIKEILGHASLSATQVYTHNTIEKLTGIHKQAHPRA
jgi:integrase/recombinase XerC